MRKDRCVCACLAEWLKCPIPCYVFIFYTGMQNCLKNEVYDPVEDKWTALMDTPSDFGHIHRTVAIIDDVAYLLGKGCYMLLISVYCCDTNKSTCYR